MSQAQPGQLVFPDRHSLQAGLCWSTSTRAWHSEELTFPACNKAASWESEPTLILANLLKSIPEIACENSCPSSLLARVAFRVKDGTRARSEEGWLFSQAIPETSEKNIN